MSGFRVGVAALSGPAQRLQQISLDLTTAGSGAATAAGSGGAAAGDPAVVAAAAVFEAGVRTVLGALGEEAGLLGDKVQRAGITYETTDRTAMPTAPGGSAPPGPHPSAFTDPDGSTTDPSGSTPSGSTPSGSTPRGAEPAPGSGTPSEPAPAAPTGSTAPPATAPPAPATPATPSAPAAPATPPAASGPPAPPAPPAPAPEPVSVQVGRGDSLWAIAAQRLGPGASDAAIATESQRWYATNRDLIGADPDVIHAGITLRAPEPGR
ncbi:MAG TPA: hypothetical protein VE547_18710 [Mycobacteriales bacterium]|nr:hypothetical protein [Mycobacteriales bacterium]